MTCVPAVFSDVVPITDLPASLQNIGVMHKDGLIFTPRHSFLSKGNVPGFVFDVSKEDGTVLGATCITFTVNHHHIARGGHVGVEVLPEFRSQGYGVRFTKGLLPLLKEHGVTEALLTCVANHEAAMDVCRGVGGIYLDELPAEQPGQTAMSRFLVKL